MSKELSSDGMIVVVVLLFLIFIVLIVIVVTCFLTTVQGKKEMKKKEKKPTRLSFFIGEKAIGGPPLILPTQDDEIDFNNKDIEFPFRKQRQQSFFLHVFSPPLHAFEVVTSSSYTSSSTNSSPKALLSPIFEDMEENKSNLSEELLAPTRKK